MLIYQIQNQNNGKVYIGQTTSDPELRWRQHRNLLRRGVHPNKKLQHAWDKHEEVNFVFRVVEYPSHIDDIDELERLWIGSVDGHHYNLTTGGKSFHMTDDVKQRISATLKGRAKTAEHNAKVSAAMKGKKKSDAHIQKMKAVRLSDEQKAHLRAINLKHRTHCPHGHEYSVENTRIDKKGVKNCRTCARIRTQTRRANV